MKPAREAYVITVVPTGDGPPVPQRLKRLLKVLLRGYGLRCTRIAPETPPELPIASRNNPSTPAVEAAEPIASGPGSAI